MAGSALQWFHWMYTTAQLTSWPEFARALEVRFGPSSYINFEATLFKLKQSSTLEAFMEEFAALSTRTTGLSQSNLLNCYISGVKDEIHRELLLLRPQSLQEAMGMAKVVRDKLEATKSYPSKFVPTKLPTSAPLALEKLPSLPSRLPPSAKRLTPAEMAARREKGLCFNCEEKLSPGHRCKGKHLLYIVPNDDDGDECATLDSDACFATSIVEASSQPDPLPPVPAISFQAYSGQPVLLALRLEGFIKGNRVVVLVDSGSTHNFVQSRVATYLDLMVSPSESLTVTVGNGESLGCAGMCCGMPLKLDAMRFP
ncbi:hypothetical protein Scep_004233 [Stephania cephalantha]|uniref:Ty3 transposon capsid-like protein domain-containing protein n=1 Tax=Stephania cephalantha TaxID=152367 RepID=A0AAP0PX38_9MAGN